MQRYFLDKDTNTFTKEDIHHMKNVMRMKQDDLVEVCSNGICHIAKLNINVNITFEIVEEIITNKTLDITLIQGSIKGSKIETTIRYATIFGAKEIIITEFERSISKLTKVNNKLERFKTIAKEAAELSKREIIPEIKIVEKLKQIDLTNYNYIYLADEEERLNSISLEDLENFREDTKIAIIIGPEGGISNNDRNHLIKNSVTPITLGNYIFPAEIAHIYPLVVLSKKTFDN